MKNQLYYGDNIDILRASIQSESVDLCYIDPPFNSKRKYNQIYNNLGGEDTALAQAFTDTWTWDNAAEEGLLEILENADNIFPARLVELITSFETVLGKGSLLAYLISMSLRINEIHRVLKTTGSFFLHCDPTASHYLKILCDSIFIGHGGEFHNEIIWRRTGSHNKIKRFGPIHDVIFFYTKSDKYKWLYPKKPYMKGHVDENFQKVGGKYTTKYYGNVLTGSGVRKGESGKPWRGVDPTAKGRHWAIPKAVKEDILEGVDDIDFDTLSQHEKLDLMLELGFIKFTEGNYWPVYERTVNENDGQPIPDIWAFQPYTEGTVFGSNDGIDKDVKWLSPKDSERLGYPTQKPEGLLERIILSCTDKEDVVLDAYCGCGTTVAVAQNLNRNWICIDITYQSIGLIIKRLIESHGKEIMDSLVLSGIPKDFDSAKSLAERKDDRVRKEFEKWAVLTYSDNKAIINEKKGADGGIDGYAKIVDDIHAGKNKYNKILFSVKSGKNISVKDIRDFRGVIEREGIAMGVFITLYPPKKTMLQEAVAAGKYESSLMQRSYPKILIVSIEEILNGHRLEMPIAAEVLKKAKAKTKNTKSLF